MNLHLNVGESVIELKNTNLSNSEEVKKMHVTVIIENVNSVKKKDKR